MSVRVWITAVCGLTGKRSTESDYLSGYIVLADTRGYCKALNGCHVASTTRRFTRAWFDTRRASIRTGTNRSCEAESL